MSWPCAMAATASPRRPYVSVAPGTVSMVSRTARSPVVSISWLASASALISAVSVRNASRCSRSSPDQGSSTRSASCARLASPGRSKAAATATTSAARRTLLVGYVRQRVGEYRQHLLVGEHLDGDRGGQRPVTRAALRVRRERPQGAALGQAVLAQPGRPLHGPDEPEPAADPRGHGENPPVAVAAA